MKDKSVEHKFQALPVLQRIVSDGLCTGCGVCTAQQGVSEEVQMKWNNEGFLVPDFSGTQSMPEQSLRVCPFNPFPEAVVRTEDELAGHFLESASKKHLKIGRYIHSYVGYAADFRSTSSSGGMASYIAYQLLSQGIVNTIFSVKYDGNDQHLYQYSLLQNKEDVIHFSKTRYYPVTMAEAMKKLASLSGKVAIVGVPCFIKAIRLHQFYNPADREKIAFLIGIICGGMKSRFFTEYLASKSGVQPDLVRRPEFRVKDPQSDALDYSFACEDENSRQYAIKMRSMGDMWGTGLFKNNACDFCDDVVAELADITLGDAWIPPYMKDGKGNNVIITRSALAEEIVQSGIENQELVLNALSDSQFVQSQQGGYNHRHKGMRYRIHLKKKTLGHIPPKRFDKQRIPLEFQWVQKMRMKVRALSLSIWIQEKQGEAFDLKLHPYLKRLWYYTRTYHRIRRIRTILKK